MEICPEGTTGVVTYACLEGGTWHISGPDKSGCIEETAAELLHDEINSRETEAVEIASSLENLLESDEEDILDADVLNLLNDLNDLQVDQLDASNATAEDRVETAKKFAEHTLSIGSILLTSGENSDQEEGVAANVTGIMEDVAFIVADQLDNSATYIPSKSIDMTCGNVPRRMEALDFPGDELFKEVPQTKAIAKLPPSTFASDATEQVSIAILEYKTITNIGKNVFSSQLTTEELVNESAPVVNSIMLGVSASRNKEPIRTFENGETFEFTLLHENPNITGNVSCVFWDEADTTDSSAGSFSSSGCEVVPEGSNDTHTKCACSHLTNFAILLDVTGVHQGISDEHTLALQIITNVGCTISIVCLAICIFAFSFFKSLWNTRTTIHRNLCISLLVAELLFLIGIERTEDQIVCSVIAAVLHYCFLCAFAWMCLEGVQLYIMLVHVFSTSSKVLPYYLAGYGVPAVVVAIAGGVSKGKGYGSTTYCWLAVDRGFIWSFAGPVAVIILANVVLLVVSIRTAYSNRSAVSKDATNSKNMKAWIKGAVTLTFLLGSTWGIGFFFLAGSTLPLAYAFTILNSLQGMFIFVYHCLGNERIKKELAKLLLRQPCLPACLRTRLEAMANVGSSVYSTTQSSVGNEKKAKKPDTVALTEKKDTVHPVVYIQDVDEEDGKPRSWLYNKDRVGDVKATPPSDLPDPDYY